MKAVVQRVSFANVKVDNAICGSIEKGFLVLLGVCEGDTENECKILSDKIARMRIFCDENDKMNLSPVNLIEKGEDVAILVISQFTLCANTRHGNRPDFFGAAKPDFANELYEKFICNLESDYNLHVEKGVFGAHMEVSLLNDGPVTIILDTNELK